MRARRLLLVAVVLVLLVGSVGLAQAPDAHSSVDGLKWDTSFEYGTAILTLVGPNGDGHVERSFGADQALYLSIYDEGGNALSDGSYHYEWRFAPYVSESVQSQMRGVDEQERTLLLADLQHEGVLPDALPVISGNFYISEGALVLGDETEEALDEVIKGQSSDRLSSDAGLRDIVHSDDVIIDGSLCVGNDCYSGLAFGFDTEVLMENNLRIFFDDTSTIQNYPRNDWRIIANDSTDGGGNYFAIEDATKVSNIFVLEAGAPDNALYVDSHGDVGINTSTPYYELHIVDGDSPAIRLDQDGSYGWEPQKWDICGNESNFFIRDATHASKLPFRIEPEAPTDSIFIKSDGKVGIGTGAPGAALEIETSTFSALYLDRVGGAQARFVTGPNIAQLGTTSANRLEVIVNSQTVARFDTDLNTTLYGDLTVQGTIYRSDGTVVGQLDAPPSAENDADLAERIAALELLVVSLQQQNAALQEDVQALRELMQ